MNGVTAMDENGEDIKSPIKRLGSTRKLLIFNNIRLQLNEQLRCLDVRMESQVSLIQELQDFFRRRGEVELDYSKSLDKLAKSLLLRHKEQKQKREQWPMFSSYACWQQLVNQTKSLSKDHAALSEIYSTHLVVRLQTVIEDVQRIYKKCREIGYETHEEILRVLQELHTTMKTYHSYQTECKAAETKLRTAETQRMKLQQTIPKEKLERSKKYRLIEKEMLKRKNKYSDARLKALKAKNEYQLCLEASNTTIHKYFVEDLSDLIDCMDLGFHSMVSRALLMHVTADQGRCRAVLHNADNLSHIVQSMDSPADKQKFLAQHHAAFMIPKRLEFQGQVSDDTVEPELQKALHSEMEARLQHLGQRVSNLRTESEEIWKTLETAEINLLEILNTKDYDSSSHFGDSTTQSAKPESLTIKLKADKQEIEEFYITKIREYILGTSRIARLDAKAELLRNALAKDSVNHSNTLVKSNVPKRKRIGRMNMTGHPKLFGGSLEEYLEVTCEEIPLIMRSCIRVINLYGLHHQGIFRVSGSQVEISNFREGFERGEDPLADTTDASDINSVAGVLKLYLRELREPLFPIIYFDHFVTLAQLESKHELVLGIRKFLQSLPRSVIIVIRYLFAFLNHLSEYSDENMMDAYNLAICFGPTLMPAPEDKDQVQYQNQVNELIKNMIVFHADLFPKDLGGFVYEKYISQEPFDCDVGDSPTDQVTEDPDSEVYPSEDESDTMEATAQFDFNARSNRELSLRKGDLVTLRKQVSNDWWQGTVKGKDGLVPDKYISLKIKDEDRDKDHLKSSSSEESVRKRRPSGTISVKSQLSVFSQNSHPTETDSTPSTNHQKSHHQQQPLNDKIENTSNAAPPTSNNIPIPNKQLIESDFHYEVVDNVKNKYNYHDEPHSFENSMEFLEDYNHFQFETKKPSEPIYAEPSKNPQPVASNSNSSSLHFEEYDGVTFRNPPQASTPLTVATVQANRKSENIRSDPSATADSPGKEDEKNRHSDSQLLKDVESQPDDGTSRPTRKYHSKSFSLSENRIAAAGSNLFHQNRELWEKRAELQSQQTLPTTRILSRNRIAPDLVMDLPFPVSKDCPTRSSRDSLDIDAEDLTSAERFAAPNQCTLKKNERFSNDSYESKKEVKLDYKGTDKPKAEVKPQEITVNTDIGEDGQRSSTDRNKFDDVLHIDEEPSKELQKSPIPARNTKKFVTQFADMKLTGGCLSSTEAPPSNNGPPPQQTLSSFKPQVKVKPQLMKKPLVLPPTTPEMSRRSHD
ncbi:SLIT-ROBO Rho GTPase-activating protein 1-like isoform X1 [Bradysia coprophila]|uniref:SLIT-ROBO Rho GTPase-activating protein 1-like isoform X1 n=1 Tax=Bradysia coprophila TaxID=38358 RepID=UPI00187D91D4|nr:SLIT-ROBO Rho GTPase-activating protein 1-like isoform X1 [Bradysia coprophila]XP_037033614.1 SLIT-ROBO Rho GTPase-activating protein 1-like isoform X1 [Bradysia coprophila]